MSEDQVMLNCNPRTALELSRAVVRERGWDIKEITGGHITAKQRGGVRAGTKINIEVRPVRGGASSAVTIGTSALGLAPAMRAEKIRRAFCETLEYEAQRVVV